MRTRRLAFGLGCLAASAAIFGAHADVAKLSKIIVPYGAGGGVDAFARPLATVIGDAQNHRVIVENRGGAGGTIGVAATLQAAPDGATIVAGGVHQPMSEALYPNRGYRIDVDFVPVAITASVPNVLVVPANSRFGSLASMLAEAKASPGKLTYCSSGNGTSQHIVAEMFKRETKLEIRHVPYRGTAAALQDLVGGFCDMMFDGLGTSMPQIEGKRLRPLAVTTAERTPFLPDVGTLKEGGGPGLDVSTWYALWAPRGVPDAALGQLRIQAKTALQHPSAKRAWEQQGAVIPSIPDEQLRSFVERETARWVRTITDLNIRAD